MAKRKPTLVFNPANLTYEQKKVSLKSKLIFGFMILSGILVFGFACVMLSHKIFPSPNEQNLKRQIAFMKGEYNKLNSRLEFITADLNTLRKRDENLYRVIYQRDPIDEKIWKTSEKVGDKYDLIREKSDYESIADILSAMEIARNKMKLQQASYNEIAALVKRKDDMINSIPSIQPITNKDLTRISSGFGWRIHPIYRIPKKHTGIDFTAPTGTPIYSTGDGVVEATHYEGGYGNSVIVNHGYSYKTRYAHMSRFGTKTGAKVKRGALLGYVGSTGASVGPHLHYEVEYGDQKVDPALFFYNDLNSNQFAELVKITNAGGKAFD